MIEELSSLRIAQAQLAEAAAAAKARVSTTERRVAEATNRVHKEVDAFERANGVGPEAFLLRAVDVARIGEALEALPNFQGVTALRAVLVLYPGTAGVLDALDALVTALDERKDALVEYNRLVGRLRQAEADLKAAEERILRRLNRALRYGFVADKGLRKALTQGRVRAFSDIVAFEAAVEEAIEALSAAEGAVRAAEKGAVASLSSWERMVGRQLLAATGRRKSRLWSRLNQA